ncbi:hypothetical protein V8C86DRAFT_2957971 [Haematococcus lacustris]
MLGMRVWQVVLACAPSYSPATLHSGTMLSSSQLKCLVEEQRAAALVLGGSALLRADGLTHFGVRKLLSGLQGVEYEGGDWLPKVVDRPKLPILLCRGNMDDPVDMLSKYMQENAGLRYPPVGHRGAMP